MPAPIQTGTFQTPQAPEYEIIKIPDVGEPGRDALKQQCFDLRITVFTHEQGFPLECETDDADETATHFLLRLVPSSEPIGTIRCVRGGDYYKLSRLVVLKEYRKYRFGRALVLALHDWVVRDARERGAAPGSYVRCVSHSQIPVKTFYAKYGYSPEVTSESRAWLRRTSEPAGDEFDEDGAPHQKMVALLRIPEPASGSESESGPASRSAADLARDPSSRGALPDLV